MKNIYDFKIEEFNELFSDVHCPVVVKFLIKEKLSLSESANSNLSSNSFYAKWDRTNNDCYMSNLNDEKIGNLTEKLSNSLKNSSFISNTEVTNYVREAQDILINAAKAAGMIKTKGKNRSNFTSNKKVWFDKDCKMKKKVYNKLRKKDDKCKRTNFEISNLRKKAAKDYKRSVRKCHKNYINTFHNNLRTLKSKFPKDYWNIINKQIFTKKHKQPSCDDFYNFFKNLGEDEQVFFEQGRFSRGSIK